MNLCLLQLRRLSAGLLPIACREDLLAESHHIFAKTRQLLDSLPYIEQHRLSALIWICLSTNRRLFAVTGGLNSIRGKRLLK